MPNSKRKEKLYTPQEAYTPEEKLGAEVSYNIGVGEEEYMEELAPEESGRWGILKEYAEPEYEPEVYEPEVTVTAEREETIEPLLYTDLSDEDLEESYELKKREVEMRFDRDKPVRSTLKPLNPLLQFIMLSTDIYTGNPRNLNYLLIQRPLMQQKEDLIYERQMAKWERDFPRNDIRKKVALKQLEERERMTAPVLFNKITRFSRPPRSLLGELSETNEDRASRRHLFEFYKEEYRRRYGDLPVPIVGRFGGETIPAVEPEVEKEIKRTEAEKYRQRYPDLSDSEINDLVERMERIKPKKVE